MEAMKTQGRAGLGPDAVSRPVGYVRTKLYNRNVIVKTLVDGGNMFGSLISSELAKLMRIPVRGTPKEVGTAAANGSVTVLGKATRPVKMYIEGINHPISFLPYVVDNLAHPVNLGENLLRAYSSDQSYRPNGTWLKINGGCVKLEGAQLDLTKPSIDVRFKQALERFTDNGRNPWSGNAEILDLRVNELEDGQDANPEDEPESGPTTEPMPGVFYQEQKKEIVWGKTVTCISNPEPVKLSMIM